MKYSNLYRGFLSIYLKMFNAAKRAEYIRRKKILHHVGSNCSFTTVNFGTEPYLISIHDNVEIASGVRFVTHDDSCHVISNYLNNGQRLDKVGSIEIFSNCFIGADAIILPNIRIGPNAIVAAGSVVTRNVDPGTIVGGNPARVIGTYDDYARKLRDFTEDVPWRVYLHDQDAHRENIVRLRKAYYWGTKARGHQG